VLLSYCVICSCCAFLCCREPSLKDQLDWGPFFGWRLYPFPPPEVLIHCLFLLLLFLLGILLLPFTDSLVTWGDRPCSLSPACLCGSNLLALASLIFSRHCCDCSFSILDVVVDSCVACRILPTWQGTDLFLCCLLANKLHTFPPLINFINARSILLVLPLAAA
jgi:hypothetical protein